MRPRADADDRIRLLKIVPTLRYGGTERQFMTLSASLDPRRFRVELACLRPGGGLAAEAVRHGMPVDSYHIGPFHSARTLTLQTRFARELSRRRIDVVHAYNFYGNVFAVPPARLAGTPVVIASIRDCGPYLTPMQLRVQRLVCRAATCVLVNARAVRDWLVSDGYDADRIAVIPNGVDLDHFSAPVDPAAVRCSLGVEPDAPLVTVVSRVTRLKGLEQFIGAAAVLAERHPRARFVVAGEPAPEDDHYLASLQKLAASLGVGDRVQFAGLRRDVPALLGASTVAVMPSLNEALSNALLESMAAGTPTVATRVGGAPEAMTHGESGLLVPPDDVAALAAAVGRLLDEPAAAAVYGRAARRVIEERFSLRTMVAATEQLYIELLRQRSARRHAA
ncbi:MAG TPA: glycosyltransferase [Vicinamibacterales bacterium]|jgi:glycosyltransferase involved in cell wall biosynthesis|nr:glycosyltransferase [Vicinamibacterales bacterium]